MKRLASHACRRWMVASTSTFVVGFVLVGCGETAPNALSKDEFVTAKQETEKIITKEYGQSAYKKAVASGKAGTK